MKLGLIGLALPPIMGGVETYNWELSRHLAKLGHDVHLFGIQNYKGVTAPEYEEIENVKIHRISGAISIGKYNFWEFAQHKIAKRIIELHESSPFSVLHAQAVFPPGLSAKIASDALNIPFVITSHGIEIMLWSKNPLYNIWRKYNTKKIFECATSVIAVSNELKDLSIKYGAAQEKVNSFANVTDLQQFQPGIEGKHIRESFGFSENDFVVLSLRRLVPKNGVQYLIDIGKYLFPQNEHIKFLICGDGPLFESMQKRVKQLNFEKYYTFVGTIQNKVIPQYIAASDLAAFPSLAEATSIACLECMSMKTPVITSNVGGLPEIVIHEKNGLLIDFINTTSSFIDYGLPEQVVGDFANGIKYLADNPELCDSLGEFGSDYVHRNHTWDIYVKKVLKIYNRLLI